MEQEPPFVPGRSCGDCALCCKVMGILEIDKLPGAWCPNCVGGKSCAIYERRPTECRTFNCFYLLNPELTDIWRPNKSKLVLVAGANNITAWVDPGTPAAWRKEPFYAQLKRWAVAAAPALGQVCVRIGKRAIAILPNEDTDLGLLEDNERVLLQRRHTPAGPVLSALKVRHDDPRFAQARRN